MHSKKKRLQTYTNGGFVIYLELVLFFLPFKKDTKKWTYFSASFEIISGSKRIENAE